MSNTLIQDERPEARPWGGSAPVGVHVASLREPAGVPVDTRGIGDIMHTIHVLLTGACTLGLIAVALPGSHLGAGRSHGRLVSLISFSAGLVGNTASLLPATPPWYGASVALATLGVLGWAVWGWMRAGPRTALLPAPAAGPARAE
ncbi:MAG: hypothetical protein Q4P32_07335, partial [Micrococcales bacterium]|nr:hypothetical protein [Micrococcales bacterium]